LSVLFETSLGNLLNDLETDLCPKTCENFPKLSKVYYYNLKAFFNVQKDLLAQTGDPTATGTGGESICSFINNNSLKNDDVPRFFTPEISPKLKHHTKGTVFMAVAPENGTLSCCASQFFVTLADNTDYLDGVHVVFGHVVEGLETLDKLNNVFAGKDLRPMKDVRIRHVVTLDDRYPDPPGLNYSFRPVPNQTTGRRVEVETTCKFILL
ncbi:cyclophilin-like domain-containing protein, partial [Lentinula raphanica]